MFDFDVFYYSETENQLQLTDVPSGVIIVEELLRGNPCYWLDLVSAPITKPKKLLINDWRARTWSPEYIVGIIQALKEKLAQGHEVYTFQDNEWYAFNMHIIDELANPEPNSLMTPVPPEILIELAINQLACSRDQVLILDDFGMQVLVGDLSPTDKRQISLSRFTELNESERIILLDILSKSPEPVGEIIDDVFDSESDAAYLQLTSKFARARVNKVYFKGSLSKSQLLQIIREGSIVVGPRTITLKHIQTLTQLIIYDDGRACDYTAADLNIFISTILSNLTSCNLGPLTQDIANQQIPQDTLSNLRVFNLSKLSNQHPSWQVLIHASNELDDLILTDCRLLEDTNAVIRSDSFKKLHKLIIDNGTISAAILNSILAEAQNLTMLHLYSKEAPTLITAQSLPKLNVLRLGNKLATIKNICNLLNAAPNLNQLRVEHAHLSADELDLKRGSLSHLEYIDLNNVTIEAQQLINLLAAPVKLQGLHLVEVTVNGNFTWEQLNLKNVIKIGLGGKIIHNIKQLQQLLLLTPNLNNLALYHCKFIAALPSEAFLPLQELEKLCLEEATVTIDNFKQLLSSVPKLKTLRLAKITQRGEGTLEFPLGLTQSLEELDMGGNITLEYDELQQYLDAFTCLKVLSFKGRINISPAQRESLAKQYPRVNINLVNSYMPPQRREDIAPTLHNPEVLKHFQPAPASFVFEYRGTNQSKNQLMFVEKISQYLTLTGQNLHHIPKIQNGICTALAQLFLSLSLTEWEQILASLQAWNGRQDSLTDELQAILNRLWTSINLWQITLNSQITYFLGDNLAAFINQLQTGCLLRNPWHCITIKPDPSSNKWFFYDPNNKQGAILVTKEELVPLIKRSLGALVFSVAAAPQQQASIANLNQFVEAGGLLALIQCNNAAEILSQAQLPQMYTEKALEGLLIRNNAGIPAWFSGLQDTDVCNFTLELLYEFWKLQPDPQSILQNSIEHIAPSIRQACLDNFLDAIKHKHLNNDQVHFVNIIIETIQSTPQHVDYDAKLQTWRKYHQETIALETYCQNCLASGAPKRRLIELESTNQVHAMHFALEQQCIQNNRPYFYIHSPKDLASASTHIHRRYNRGIITKGPGGPLHNFLTANKNGKAPVLIINYENFDNRDLVRLNSILGKEATANWVPLPADTTIIGLSNSNKSNYYQGSEFNSRFNLVENPPVAASALEQAIPTLPFIPHTANKHPIINLFNSCNWESYLLGTWVVQEDGLHFQEGELVKKLKESNILEIQNGPWQDPNFLRFWQQACLRGYVDHAGRRINIPRNLQLIKSQGYDWNSYQKYIHLHQEVPAPEILNPNRLHEFLNRYEYRELTKTLSKTPGLVESQKQAQAKSRKRKANQQEQEPVKLNLLLTRDLDENQWAELLDKCKEHEVHLQIQCAPGVRLPPALAQHAVIPIPTAVWNGAVPTVASVIQSSDIDTTVYQLQQQQASIVIDVSECRASDLLERLDANFDSEQLLFHFDKTAGALLTALKAGKKVILKGRFSNELIDKLAPLLLNPSLQRPGSIYLVSDQQAQFNYLANYTHVVSIAEKLHCLEPLNPRLRELLTPYLETPLSTLQACKAYLTANPLATHCDNLWAGMYHLHPQAAQTAPLNPQTSAQEAQACTKTRIEGIYSILAYAPYVYLTGLSGVGKTTLVTEILKTIAKVFEGKSDIPAWANSNEPGLKLLFIDEANLDPSQWSMFEGLYDIPPHIVYKGVLYYLTENHKVIFAGNPLSYGNARKLAPFFIRHGNALVLDPLPPCVLYEDILKPLFDSTNLQDRAPEICQHFVNVYQFIAQQSQSEVLICPRELQMMAILTIAMCKFYPQKDPNEFAAYYAYQLGKNLLPQAAEAEFDEAFNPHLNLKHVNVSSTPDFLLTPSRFESCQKIVELLCLRHLRQSGFGSKDFQYGGLGGMILEGEAASGKSELVVFSLEQAALKEIKSLPDQVDDPNLYIRMPNNLNLTEQQEFLIKACDLGLVVVIEELNSSPVLEFLLNDLLMGKIPGKEKPQKPGFMIIATQNPVTDSGRQRLSTALMRRLSLEKIQAYTCEDMFSILRNKGLTARQAQALMHAYENNAGKASYEKLKPAPCFRDVLNIADELVAMNKNAPRVNFVRAHSSSSQHRASLKPNSPIHKNSHHFFHHTHQRNQALAKAVQNLATTEINPVN